MADKVAIVTGAGRGIGRAAALALAREGYSLTLAARSEDQLARSLQSVRRLRAKALAAPTDVTVAGEVQAMVDATVEAFGRIDLLVNAAGTDIHKANIESFSESEFDATMAVHVKGVFLTTRAAWPILQQQRDGGVIVNVSSLATRQPACDLAVYAAAKSAVNALTAALAEAGRPRNIRLFAVCPGHVETSLMRAAFPDVPPQECLTPAQVADLIVWCASDAARHCSGECFWIHKT